jgi:hypothetical protein
MLRVALYAPKILIKIFTTDSITSTKIKTEIIISKSVKPFLFVNLYIFCSLQDLRISIKRYSLYVIPAQLVLEQSGSGNPANQVIIFLDSGLWAGMTSST